VRFLQFFLSAGLVLLLSLGVGPLWVAVKRAGLPEGWLLLRPPGEVSALLIEQDTVWAGGNGGLTAIDRRTGARLPLDKAARGIRQVRALMLEEDGTLWAAHGAGIDVRRDGVWRRVAGSEGLWSALARAREGAMWTAGERGLARVEHGQLRIVATAQALGLGPLTLVWEEADGRVWVASHSRREGGVVVLNEEGGAASPAWRARLPHRSVNAMRRDGQGRLWVATGFGREGGVLCIGEEGEALLTKAQGLPGEMIRTLWMDGRGRMWVGSEYDGVAYESDGGWRTLTPDDGLAGWEVKALAEDVDGQLWMGSESGMTRMPVPSPGGQQ
jgi:ligand-binding sensor domain-containing protein